LKSDDAASAAGIPVGNSMSNSGMIDWLVVAAPYRRVDVGSGG